MRCFTWFVARFALLYTSCVFCWSLCSISFVFWFSLFCFFFFSMSGIPRGIDHIETLVWILSGTMSITFRRTRRRTYIRMALNMSSKRRRIRGALDMPYLCSGTFMALIRPTFLCTPAFCAYMFLRRVSCFVFCKVLAVLCFCSL